MTFWAGFPEIDRHTATKEVVELWGEMWDDATPHSRLEAVNAKIRIMRKTRLKETINLLRHDRLTDAVRRRMTHDIYEELADLL